MGEFIAVDHKTGFCSECGAEGMIFGPDDRCSVCAYEHDSKNR